MPRFFLRMSFKGTAYSGWQIQDNAISVQEKLNHALSTVMGYAVETIGCGRTDTGVHAKQFFTHFDVPEIPVTNERFFYSLNSILPPDISIHEIIPVKDNNHARFDATSRTYEYFVNTGKNSFLREFTMFTPVIPDIALMNEAASHLTGTGDYSSFSKTHTQVKTNICEISKATWEQRKGLFVFTITADRFLRGMVRAIVGTLLDAGISKIEPARIREIINSKNRSEAGVTVPACGLYLSEIKYPYIPDSVLLNFPA